jgi:hypothetical protein
MSSAEEEDLELARFLERVLPSKEELESLFDEPEDLDVDLDKMV